MYRLFLDIDLAFSALISNRFDHTVMLLIFAVIDFRGFVEKEMFFDFVLHRCFYLSLTVSFIKYIYIYICDFLGAPHFVVL